MKISIITTSYNSASTIRDTIESVIAQDYPDIEHIIVDGASNDDTLAIVKSYGDRIARIISEPDKGIYDAMNKGIRAASGDVIGILNSDDFFTSADVLSTVAKTFLENDIEALYGDVHFVNSNNLQKQVRYYSSKIFKPTLFRFGFMPAHPSFYMKKSCYETYGLYPLDYKIAADYELLIRYLYKYGVRYKYVAKDFITMRTGGVSTENIKSRIVLNQEIVKACAKYGIKTNMFLLSLKYFYKIFELRK
ncbi:MAG: glycosyltransferase [Dysgonamonadaceae bacterium]|jgi:glycosyltransferase involved in cell wall biosynthesis|nr:glycosyltransferase [Dysgonamonadaceae bacterium]